MENKIINVEKAIEIARKYDKLFGIKSSEVCCVTACQEMAEWKDEYYYNVITELVGAAYNSCTDSSKIDEVLKKYGL